MHTVCDNEEQAVPPKTTETWETFRSREIEIKERVHKSLFKPEFIVHESLLFYCVAHHAGIIFHVSCQCTALALFISRFVSIGIEGVLPR